MESEEVYDANHTKFNELWKSGWRCYYEEYTIIKGISINKEYSESCLQNMRIMDLGCGSGDLVAHMIEKGAEKAVGVDISQKMIDDANDRLFTREDWYSRFAFEKANCFSIENMNEIMPIEKYAHYFDAISSIFLICYAESERELSEFFRLCNRYLKDNGNIALITLNPRIALEFAEYQEKTKNSPFRLISMRENNGLPVVEGGFYDIETNELKFTIHPIVYSREQIQQVLEENGFETEEMEYPAFHPDFDVNVLSPIITMDFLTRNDSKNIFCKAKKVRSL
ncbi:unnamed protein product [Blepharisma stoltei]|uniref:Methyltransferase domain-containing protein n=1 Tax=Blepharisma stoltei TaxID=1481888 RepID=A0AAU9K7E9_9CILI|nr:unnamed protein product [Blepharisma stoltei]